MLDNVVPIGKRKPRKSALDRLAEMMKALQAAAEAAASATTEHAAEIKGLRHRVEALEAAAGERKDGKA
jgi:hypothetical protein